MTANTTHLPIAFNITTALLHLFDLTDGFDLIVIGIARFQKRNPDI